MKTSLTDKKIDTGRGKGHRQPIEEITSQELVLSGVKELRFGRRGVKKDRRTQQQQRKKDLREQEGKKDRSQFI